MLDTVKLKSPILTEEQAGIIETYCQRVMSVRLEDNSVEWELTKAQLAGSYDHRISLRIERGEWRTVTPTKELRLQEFLRTGVRVAPQTIKVNAPPRLLVECSIHKAMCGHNLLGGPTDPRRAIYWFVRRLSNLLGISLPPSDDWEVERVDWAETYNLGYVEAVHQYIHALNSCSFPRRENVARFGRHGLNVPGSTTTVKIYSKEDEFKVHDLPRLSRWCKLRGKENYLMMLQYMSEGLLRVEVEVKGRKLDKDLGGKIGICYVRNLTAEYLRELHYTEVGKLIKEAKSDMEVVREDTEVKTRLVDTYGKRQGRALFGSWLELSTRGEDFLKADMCKSTYYLHLKLLADAGVSWHGTNVRLENTAIPVGFSPVRSDSRRIGWLLPEVEYNCAPLLLAA
jgi:II/X family phage/plasmid replication protein